MKTEIEPKRRPSMKRNERGLTESQDAMCRLLAWDANLSLVDAYLMAYPNFRGLRTTAIAAASRLWKRKSIKDRTAEYRAGYVAKCPLVRGEALGILADIARDPNERSATRIKAIERLQAMIPQWQLDHGDKEPPKAIEISIVNGGNRRIAPSTGGELPTIDVEVISEAN